MAEIDLPLIVRRPRGASAVSLLGSLAILGISIWIQIEREPRWFMWVLIVICGASAFLFVSQLLDSRPCLEISEEGICVPYWNVGTIPWNEISDTFVKSDGDVDYVCLKLRDPEWFRVQMGRLLRGFNTATRQTGFGDLTIRPSDMGLATNQVFELVREQLEKRQNQGGSDGVRLGLRGMNRGHR